MIIFAPIFRRRPHRSVGCTLVSWTGLQQAPFADCRAMFPVRRYLIVRADINYATI